MERTARAGAGRPYRIGPGRRWPPAAIARQLGPLPRSVTEPFSLAAVATARDSEAWRLMMPSTAQFARFGPSSDPGASAVAAVSGPEIVEQLLCLRKAPLRGIGRSKTAEIDLLDGCLARHNLCHLPSPFRETSAAVATLKKSPDRSRGSFQKHHETGTGPPPVSLARR